MKRRSVLYDECDLAMEEYPDRRITVLANEIGRAAIQDLIPAAPIDWLWLSGSLPGWGAGNLSLRGPWCASDARHFGMAFTRAGYRVLIKKGDDYEILVA